MNPEDRDTLAPGNLDDMSGAARASCRLAIPHRHENVALIEHRPAGALIGGRSSLWRRGAVQFKNAFPGPCKQFAELVDAFAGGKVPFVLDLREREQATELEAKREGFVGEEPVSTLGEG